MRALWLAVFVPACAVAALDHHGHGWLAALSVAAVLAYFAPAVWWRS